MTTLKNDLLSASSMTPAERAKGRFMRAPDGHNDGGSAGAPPAPAADPAPDPAPSSEGEQDTARQLEVEFGQVEPASPDADEAGGEAEEEGGDSDPDPEAEPKPEGASAQERIDQLTRAQREAERDAAEWRRKFEDATRQPEPPAGEERDTDPDAAPDPAKYEFGEADAKFIADTARFHARQEFAEQARQSQFRAELASMETNWETKVADPSIAERYPDFTDKVTNGAASGTWDCSPLMALGIKQSPVGPDVAYFLASNPAEAKRIAGLTNIEQAVQFGRIEGRFMNQPAASVEQPPVKPSAAPTPPNGRSRGAGGKFATPADTDDFSQFDKMADGILGA